MKRIDLPLKELYLLVLMLALFLSGKTQEYDTIYQNKIAEYTTDSRFLPSSVVTVYHHDKIPSPLDHFGSVIGAPGIMHRSGEIYGYFDVLAETSPNLIVEQVGTSEEGRPINLVTISDASTISQLEHYRGIMNQLADPRKLNRENAELLINEGKLVYFMNGAMHSAETGSPEMLMEMAYRLVTDPSEEITIACLNTSTTT